MMEKEGIGYDELCPIKIERGRKIGNIKSHVRVCVIVGLMRKGRKIILGVEGGKTYTSEINLLKFLLKYMKFKGFYFIGDKGYDFHRDNKRDKRDI